MKINTLKPIADLINQGDFPGARSALVSALVSEPGKQWQLSLGRLVDLIDRASAGRIGVAPFTVIAKGNSKLGDKFLTWSTLPATAPGGIGCPGAGDCAAAGWCYSVKAWRYPAAFARQAQNTILLQSSAGRDIISASLAKFRGTQYRVFRLYVDGDFSARPAVDGKNDFSFWMNLLYKNESIITYGYTKSFSQVLAYRGRIPDNYKINLSSGHNHSARTTSALRARDVTRGDFIAVTDISVARSAQHGDSRHRARLVKHYRAKTGRKAFACPGACNTCTPKHGHACASPKFNGIDIIIAAH